MAPVVDTEAPEPDAVETLARALAAARGCSIEDARKALAGAKTIAVRPTHGTGH